MAHYIDKAALVAEIERRRESNAKEKFFGRLVEDNYLLDFLDTLEVKEVDLEKEIKEVQREYKTIDEYDGYPATIYASSIERIAKYFFELGMQVSNKAQKGENI